MGVRSSRHMPAKGKGNTFEEGRSHWHTLPQLKRMERIERGRRTGTGTGTGTWLAKGN